MKKIIISFLILLIVAGGSLGVYLNVRKKSEKETKKQQEEIADLQLFSFSPETIDKIVINNPDASYTAQFQDDQWVLTDGGDFDLDGEYMELIRSYFSTLTASDKHSGNLEDYSLDAEHASTVTLSGGGQSYTVTIGGISPTKEYYYVMVDGKSDIYSVESVYSSGSNFSTEKMMLKSKDLVPFEDDGIERITAIKNGKVTYDLTYDDESGEWSLPEEYSDFGFDVTAVTSMINVITRLQAEQMLDENLEDMAKYGFDDPYAEVIVKGKDGTERHIIAGDFSEDGTYANMLVYDSGSEEKNQVEVYYKSDVDFVDYTPINFIATTVYNPSQYDVSRFKVAYDGQEYEFTMDQEQKKCQYNGQTIQLAVQSILTEFTNFYNSFSIYVVKKIDMEAEPELKDPLLSVEYELTDGTIKTYHLTDAGNQQCYVFVDGKYTGEITSDSSIIGNSSVRNYFDILCDEADIS